MSARGRSATFAQCAPFDRYRGKTDEGERRVPELSILDTPKRPTVQIQPRGCTPVPFCFALLYIVPLQRRKRSWEAVVRASKLEKSTAWRTFQSRRPSMNCGG